MALARMFQRRDDAATWTSVNPVLASGEWGFEKDTGKVKIGDGVTPWNGLDYSPTASDLAAKANQSALSAVAVDVATRVPQTRTVNGKALTSNISINKTDVGLSNVDNTSDANKPVSTAQQSALDLKADPAQVERVAAKGAKVRQLGGYAPPLSKCPLTKAEVSLTVGAFDGYVGSGGISYNAQTHFDWFDGNWTTSTLTALAAWGNCVVNASGPWNPGWTPADAALGTGMLSKPFEFEVMVEGTYCCTAWLQPYAGLQQHIRVWIDDEEIEDWYLGDRASGVLQGHSIIDAEAAGAGNHILNINFAERGTYKVKISGLYFTLGGGAAGNILTVGPTNRAFPVAKRPRIGIVSDSFFEITGSVTTQTTATELGHQLGANVFNFCQGGSGYVNPSASGANGDKSYASDAVFDAMNRFPKVDLLVVNGTANDLVYTDGQVTAAMQAFFNRVRTDYDPHVPIVVVGLEPVNYFKVLYPNPAMQNREALQDTTALADPNVIASLRPTLFQWINGTGYQGNPTGDGNQDFVVGPDQVHPTDYGQMMYAWIMANSIKNAITALV